MTEDDVAIPRPAFLFFGPYVSSARQPWLDRWCDHNAAPASWQMCPCLIRAYWLTAFCIR